MSKKPVSPLRQRLIDDITARRFSEDTKRDYVRNVRKFAAFLGRSPDTATSQDLRRYQLHMAQQQASPGTINAAIAALRFFFTVTVEKPDLVRPLRTVTKPRKAPVVLSQEEVARLLRAAPSLKYKAALSVAYGAGLRVSEVANLKVSDIDSGRMMLRVEQGTTTGGHCDLRPLQDIPRSSGGPLSPMEESGGAMIRQCRRGELARAQSSFCRALPRSSSSEEEACRRRALRST